MIDKIAIEIILFLILTKILLKIKTLVQIVKDYFYFKDN